MESNGVGSGGKRGNFEEATVQYGTSVHTIIRRFDRIVPQIGVSINHRECHHKRTNQYFTALQKSYD